MNKFEGEHILVTGGAGFIGSHIVDSLMNEGAHVRVLDDLSNGCMSNLSIWKEHERFSIIKGDLRNSNLVKQAMHGISIVFHQAAKVSVPFSVENPHLVTDVNVMGTVTLLDECRRVDARKVVVASSSSVYGDTPTLPKKVSMPTRPLSPYAVSKLGQEKLAVAFHTTYGLDTTALRYFNVYGPRQRGGSYAGVISIFISKAHKHEPLPIDGDGSQTRDFTYIDDVVKCNMQAVLSPRSRGKIYNVGAGRGTSINELADEVIRITNSESKRIYLAPRPGDVHDSLAGIDLTQKDLGYVPRIPLSEGLEKTIEWAISQDESQ